MTNQHPKVPENCIPDNDPVQAAKLMLRPKASPGDVSRIPGNDPVAAAKAMLRPKPNDGRSRKR